MVNTNYPNCQPRPTPVRDWPQVQTRVSPDTIDRVEAEVEATGIPKALVITQRLKLAYELHPENLTITPAPTE